MIGDMIAVRDALGWESANLAGLSMGGGLVQFAALLHPWRVRTLTAVSSLPQSDRKIRGTARYMRFFPGPFKLLFRRYGDSPEGRQRMIAVVPGSPVRPRTISDPSSARVPRGTCRPQSRPRTRRGRSRQDRRW